jgi:hypothetical protein
MDNPYPSQRLHISVIKQLTGVTKLTLARKLGKDALVAIGARMRLRGPGRPGY